MSPNLALRSPWRAGPADAPGEYCEVLDNFDFDDERLKPEHLTKLQALGRRIVNSQTSSVRIVGRTDTVGDAGYNVGLGQRRANQAAAALRRIVGSRAELSLHVWRL